MLELRAERLRRGWSQVRITMLTNISPSDVSLIERGIRQAPPAWRQRLEEAFGLPAEKLFAPAQESDRQVVVEAR
jgi:transcriptional regulator with XRE-family HTH domain